MGARQCSTSAAVASRPQIVRHDYHLPAGIRHDSNLQRRIVGLAACGRRPCSKSGDVAVLFHDCVSSWTGVCWVGASAYHGEFWRKDDLCHFHVRVRDAVLYAGFVADATCCPDMQVWDWAYLGDAGGCSGWKY